MIIDPDLPEISMIRHPRAKRLKLSVSQQGIRLTIPPDTSSRQIHAFIDQGREWLKQTWTKYAQPANNLQIDALPNRLSLTYSSLPLEIIEQEMHALFHLQQQQLQLNKQHAAYALTRFVIAQAKIILPQQLLQHAARHGLNVHQVRIATPATRWGSCSHDHNIMLHAGLLLMPEHYADYILLHELTHTLHMNHQKPFWEALEQFYPNAKAAQKQIKKFRLPHWWQVKP